MVRPLQLSQQHSQTSKAISAPSTGSNEIQEARPGQQEPGEDPVAAGFFSFLSKPVIIPAQSVHATPQREGLEHLVETDGGQGAVEVELGGAPRIRR